MTSSFYKTGKIHYTIPVRRSLYEINCNNINGMYIRWIVRKHKNATTADVAFHDAYLVESYRDERDTPRQRTICYLGNIRQIDGEFPALEREIFFLRADRILASTPEVEPAERNDILSLLRMKIPALTEEEVITAFRNNVRWFESWYRDRGRRVTRAEMQGIIDSVEGEFERL